MTTNFPAKALASTKASPFIFYQKLKNRDTAAIQALLLKTKHHLSVKARYCQARPEDTEELASDAVMTALQKIWNGSYTYQGNTPLTFTLIIADNLLRNFLRKKTWPMHPLEGIKIPQAAAAPAYFAQKELEQKVENILAQLSPAGQRIIQLKYFDGLRDEEIVERQLTAYRTVDSLKSKRCALMRKLRKSLN
jgi:RNA polymerase sigma factor (sigma-70 family)